MFLCDNMGGGMKTKILNICVIRVTIHHATGLGWMLVITTAENTSNTACIFYSTHWYFFSCSRNNVNLVRYFSSRSGRMVVLLEICSCHLRVRTRRLY